MVQCCFNSSFVHVFLEEMYFSLHSFCVLLNNYTCFKRVLKKSFKNVADFGKNLLRSFFL